MGNVDGRTQDPAYPIISELKKVKNYAIKFKMTNDSKIVGENL